MKTSNIEYCDSQYAADKTKSDINFIGKLFCFIFGAGLYSWEYATLRLYLVLKSASV